ncbi:hypothetical protein F2Q68_00002376 [Brassica cretica]|uniref:Uncharacterized protein n=1 Tax=Brassica cretica TaxID=69181 RepID=A0A8S9JGB8_BRACR|nr:hypothetical protein F2Q68_00002376 [Brassica cretica]
MVSGTFLLPLPFTVLWNFYNTMAEREYADCEKSAMNAYKVATENSDTCDEIAQGSHLAPNHPEPKPVSGLAHMMMLSDSGLQIKDKE